ncbi:MAG: hypothetical protein H0V42_03955 [Nocardioidaceae bacterium]|nr:hypothetical protein [Nocardioidaceae bacterium]
MRLVISMEGTTNRDKRPALAMGPRTRSCNCGQQLDVCVRAHCPRCGRTLARA